MVWPWNPVLYWDPIAHAGGDEFRIGVGNSSIHFRESYPYNPDYGDPFEHPEDHPGLLSGRKTILDQFHTDPHDPSRNPTGHIFYDVFGFPEPPNYPFYPY